MKDIRSKINQILLKGLSGFLAFWLSSVLVLACCGSHLFTVSASNVEEEMSCPMDGGHDCCKKDKDATNVSESEQNKDDCCVFKPTKILSTDLQKQQDVRQTLAVTEKTEKPKPVYFIKNSYKPTKVYHSAIRNRGSTYLQNCVFRI